VPILRRIVRAGEPVMVTRAQAEALLSQPTSWAAVDAEAKQIEGALWQQTSQPVAEAYAEIETREHRRPIQQGPARRQARRWGPRDDDQPARLVVRCKGRRIMMIVGWEEPAPVRLTQTGDWSLFVLDGARFRPDHTINPAGTSGPTRTVNCPNHFGGHVLSGARLREALDRLSRPRHAANVDVAEVEVPAKL